MVKWDTWESCGSSILPTDAGKTGCYCPKECVLILEGGLGSCALGKGKKRGVRGDLEVSPWFSNSEKGCEGPGLGREKAWKEYSYWKFFVKFWKYCGCLNQVGDRKEECVWLEEIKSWEGSGKLCGYQR